MNYYRFLIIVFLSFLLSCSDNRIIKWENYDEITEIIENSTHEISRMRFKRIQSLSSDKNDIFKPFHSFLKSYDISYHESLKKLILNNDISTIQKYISQEKFSYEDLVKFFIYRIYIHEFDKNLYLNAIISLNPNVINEARDLDNSIKKDNLLYGIPLLIKDNINVKGLATTAGASVFENNYVDNNAFVINQLKENNVLILGKLNMSEWAYYFCRPCPVGYSSLGGQTLNPYGRKKFESGGSSSGSGVSIAANYAMGSLGSETSGSILSPSSKNSLVGLKATIGNISRSGIIPISSFYDTSGPMTTNVMDNVLLYNGMIGYDKNDNLSYEVKKIDLKEMTGFKGSKIKVGISERYNSDSLVINALNDLKEIGVESVSFKSKSYSLPHFRNILTSDMKRDLPQYILGYGNKKLSVKNVKDIVSYNSRDTFLHAPYDQMLFKEIVNDSISNNRLHEMKEETKSRANNYLNSIMKENDFDVFVSVDNDMAGIAAAAHYPALTIPMGYRHNGQPANITFITRSNNEQLLYNLGFHYEKISMNRKVPDIYKKIP
ncbi:MAG: amidase [Candidatus Pelagibacter sp. TMED153]|nr:MAG: amidase [Candidatus Pelagibacter sp. TMED153]|tara:strand:- start:4926 stop:6572 length:1647 start_codon:yes stop_codon:yes gene_type:complete